MCNVQQVAGGGGKHDEAARGHVAEHTGHNIDELKNKVPTLEQRDVGMPDNLISILRVVQNTFGHREGGIGDEDNRSPGGDRGSV